MPLWHFVLVWESFISLAFQKPCLADMWAPKRPTGTWASLEACHYWCSQVGSKWAFKHSCFKIIVNGYVSTGRNNNAKIRSKIVCLLNMSPPPSGPLSLHHPSLAAEYLCLLALRENPRWQQNGQPGWEKNVTMWYTHTSRLTKRDTGLLFVSLLGGQVLTWVRFSKRCFTASKWQEEFLHNHPAVAEIQSRKTE